MRTNLLLLGMLIPFAAAVAYYAGEDAEAVPSAADRVHATPGARVATGDIDRMLAGDALEPSEAPPTIPSVADHRVAEAAAADGGSSQRAEPGLLRSWLDAMVDWLPRSTPRTPVLLVLVEGEARVEIARRGVRDDRIWAESADAFALDGNRIVAADRDAAAAMILALDWVDRPIQILSATAFESPLAYRERRAHAERAARVAPAAPDAVAAEVSAVRASDQARVQAAIDTVRGSAP